MSSSKEDLMAGLFNRSEFDGIGLGSTSDDAIARWGAPEESVRTKKGGIVHHWGLVQLWCDSKSGVVVQVVVTTWPDAPLPTSPNVLIAFQALCALILADLPVDAFFSPMLSDEYDLYYALGDVSYCFEAASECVRKICIAKGWFGQSSFVPRLSAGV